MNTIDQIIKQLNAAVHEVADSAVEAEAALVEYQQRKAGELYALLDSPGPDTYLSCTSLVSRLMKTTLASFEEHLGQPIPRVMRVKVLAETESAWFKQAVEFVQRKKAYTTARLKAEAQQ